MTTWRCRPRWLLLVLALLLVSKLSGAQEAGVVTTTPADNATGAASGGDAAAATVAPAVGAVAVTAAPTPTEAAAAAAATEAPSEAPAASTATPELQALASLSSSGSSSIDDGDAGSSSTSGSIDSNQTLVPGDLGPQDAETGSHDGPLTRAKLIVIIVVAASGACVMLGLVGWCCMHRKRQASKDMSSPLAMTLPGPESIIGGAYEVNTGQFEVGRTNSNAMIAVMGDPIERKQSRASRITRLSLHRESVSNARHLSNASDHQPTSTAMVMAPAYRLSRPLGSSSSPSSLRSNGQFKNTNQSMQSFRDFDYSAVMSETSTEGRPSYSSLADYQPQRAGGAGSNRVAAPLSPTVAVLELHRFSGTSSTASMSSMSSFKKSKSGVNIHMRSFVAQDLTQPAMGDFRMSSGGGSSRLSSSSTEDMTQASTRGADGGGDSRRLDWYNSIKSPAEDDRYTRLNLSAGDSEDEDEALSSNERYSYEL